MSRGTLMDRISRLAKKYDALLPWLLLAAVGGATLAVLQVLVVRLLH